MTTAAVILAAGKGTRFRSDMAKVLHPVLSRTMLHWVLESVRSLDLDRVVVVVGHQGEQVAAEAHAAGIEGLVTVTQAEQLGTGNAVRCAAADGALDDVDTVLVLPGDVPLLQPEPLRELLAVHGDHAATVLTAELDDPTGYGRVLRDAYGGVQRIVEHRDATEYERTVREVNTSIYAFDRALMVAELEELRADNDQGEEYLTDVIEPLVAKSRGEGEGRAASPGLGVAVVVGPDEAVRGVNDRAQLADAATALRRRILHELMHAGVTVEDPATTHVGPDVRVEADALLLSGTRLEGHTRVAAGARIGPDTRVIDSIIENEAQVTYSVLVETRVGPGAAVGPYAHLRAGTELGRETKVGSFVEVKKSTIGRGSKVPHLSYVGDAEVGDGANIGAATITVNYDGYDKHRTVIGDGARIGADTMLVAPVTVGARAYTGAGSVITTDVPDGALAVERAEQRTIDGYADRRAARHERPAVGEAGS